LKPETRGELLWIENYTLSSLGLPSGNLTVLLGTGFPVDPETRVFVMNIKETMQWMGFDLDTGEKLWGPVGNPRAFNFYGCIGLGGSGQVGYIAYGNLYVAGYGGELFCYDLKTGNLNWKYNNTFSGLSTPWGNYPIFIGAIADGKVYVYSGEHSPNAPPYKGEKVRCIDAFTGKELWTLLGWASVGAFADQGLPIADGFLAYLNVYDMQIYCIGKGPSEATVTASPKVSTLGSSILIEGTVMDISPGTRQHEQAMRFPHGLPAVSDEDQSAWMEYVYMQKPKPQGAKGVLVELYAIKEDGTSFKIGDAITDPLNGGTFKYLDPTRPGNIRYNRCVSRQQ
jgi:outer membrane protein assembly factor BamB